MKTKKNRIGSDERIGQASAKARAMRKGSAMMEYVIVLSALAVGLIVFMNHAFYDTINGFGPLGQGLVAFYQRTFGGLSLPIP